MIQVILFREQMVLLEGNELALSLMMAWWLVGIAAGALLPKRFCSESKNDFWLIASILFLPFTLAACTALIRFAPWILSIPSQENPSPLQVLIISAVSVFPSSLSIGFTFPLLSIAFKNCSTSRAGSSAVADVFIYEALGSVLGGILLLLQVVPRWPPFAIAVFALMITLVLFINRIGRKISAVLFLSLLVLSLGKIPQKIDSWAASVRWQIRHEGFQFIRAKETPYQRLELGERDGQTTVFGNGSPLFSFPDDYTYSQWAAMSLSQYPNPQTVLSIGAAGSELYPFYAQWGAREFLGIELDRGIHEIIGERQAAESSTARPAWAHADAIRYLTGNPSPKQYDLIAIKQPDPLNAVLNRFYTREFFQLLRKSLAEDGVVALTISGTPNYEMGDVGFYCGTLYWTLRDVFPQVLAVPGMEWWFFASPSRIFLDDPQKIIDRYKRLHPSSENFSPEIYRIYYDSLRIQQMEKAFQLYADTPRNSDARPLCYLYNLLLWTKQYGYLKRLPVESLAFTGWTLAGIGAAGVILLFLAALGITRAASPKLAKGASTPLAVLLLAGMSAMAAEIAIILFYQSRVGYLYQRIGIFFGAFMLGLALGAAFARRLHTRNGLSAATGFILLEITFAILLLLTPALLKMTLILSMHAICVEIALLLWLAILAFMMGTILPSAARMAEGQGTALASLAGSVDAFDCAGGAIGAIVAGLFLIPTIGLINLFYVLAGINIVCGILLLGRLRKSTIKS